MDKVYTANSLAHKKHAWFQNVLTCCALAGSLALAGCNGQDATQAANMRTCLQNQTNLDWDVSVSNVTGQSSATATRNLKPFADVEEGSKYQTIGMTWQLHQEKPDVLVEEGQYQSQAYTSLILIGKVFVPYTAHRLVQEAITQHTGTQITIDEAPFAKTGLECFVKKDNRTTLILKNIHLVLWSCAQ